MRKTETLSAQVQSKSYPKHFLSSIEIAASPEEIFSLLDDPRKISSHMEKSSWMMAGSSMKIELDQKKGKELGAEIILRGSMMSIPLFVRERITERQPPNGKFWKQLGFRKCSSSISTGWDLKLNRRAQHLSFRYLLITVPTALGQHLLGLLFGKVYARWCTEQMAKDAAYHFGK